MRVKYEFYKTLRPPIMFTFACHTLKLEYRGKQVVETARVVALVSARVGAGVNAAFH